MMEHHDSGRSESCPEHEKISEQIRMEELAGLEESAYAGYCEDG
jgi:hypothetical protein